MERQIVHCDLDTSIVSVDQFFNSILIGNTMLDCGVSERAVVSSCSFEVRRFGVRSAMPMRRATRSYAREQLLTYGLYRIAANS
jgi:DNA polymerase-4